MAARPGTVETLALHIGLALRPLAERLAGSGAISSFAEMGLAFPPELLAPRVVATLDEGAAAAQSLSDAIDPLSAAIDAGDSAGVVLAAAHVGDALVALAGALTHVGTAIDAVAAGLPGLDSAEVADFAQTLPSRLLGHLVVSRLEGRQPGVAGLANLLGVLDIVPAPGVDAVHPPFTQRQLRLDRLGDLLLRPESLLRTLYRWGEPDFDGAALLTRLATSLRLLGVPAQVDGAAPTALATGLAAMQADPPGLAATLQAELPGGIDLTLPLDDVWSARLVSRAPVESGIGVTIAPPAAFTLHPPAPLDTTLSTELIARAADAVHPIVVFGQTQGSRLQADVFRFGLGVEIAWDATALEARALPRVNLAAQGAQAVLDFSGADGFIGSLTGGAPLAVQADFELRWSPVGGLQFSASADGPQIKLPAALSVAGVTVAAVNLGLRPDAGALGVEVSADLVASIGPVRAAIERTGLAAMLRFEDGNLGPLDLSLGFKAPSGVGLSIDAGPLVGGGFLAFDPQRGEYAGEIHLQFEVMAVRAIGLLTTHLPGGQRGYSLLVIVSAEFPPVQLGLGFMLVGVGGLLGINRTVAVEALRAGLKTGALGAVLSPPDPKASVEQLVASLAGLFPPAAGRHVFAPTARIVWGTPTQITIELALVLELPAPVRLVALGRLRAVLPDAREAIVRIQVDVLGVIDFDRAEAAVDATLVDSRLAQFALTGEMALRMSWGAQPAFLLAVGGFHPRFAAPPGFPALERVAVALAGGDNPKLRLEAYLALTSNTVQFGARVDLAARAGSFSIAGFLSFDALVTLAPLAFVVDIAAKLAVKAGGRTILSVSLELTLSGPRPWRARGRASFSILFFDVSFGFDVTIGDAAPAALPAPVDVAPLLLAALADRRAWSAAPPAGGGAVVTLRALEAGTAVLAHPLATLEVRQRVAPLERTLERFGTSVPSGARRFRITLATIGGVRTTLTPLQDRFAPAQFSALSDDAKLSAPSFEEMTSGAALGADGYATGAAVNVSVVYEQLLVTAPGVAPPRSQRVAFPGDVFGTLTATPAEGPPAFALREAA